MGYFQKNKLTTNQLFIHEYTGIEKQELNNRIHDFMTSTGVF